MADQIQEVKETTTQGGVPTQTTRRVTTSDTAADERAVAANRAGDSTVERVIYFLVGLLSAVLVIRLILSLLGANRDNGFANLIYSVSYPFVAPFFGLFGYKVQYGLARFEIETLVAIAVYALLGYGVVKLIRIFRKAD